MKNIIRKLFGITTYNFSVSVTFKSGKTVKIPCDEFNFTYANGQLTSYDFTGVQAGAVKFMALSEIAFISYKNY